MFGDFRVSSFVESSLFTLKQFIMAKSNRPPNGPSTTGKPSGGGRGNNPSGGGRGNNPSGWKGYHGK